jgi:hypothetical protein
LLALVCASTFAIAAPARARVFVGIGIPFGPVWAPSPYYYPPPVYYPPAPYYAPPPVVYAPPQTYAPQSYAPQTYSPQSYGQAQPQGGQTCYAQSYRCPMDRPVAYGAACYCLGNGGQHIWGQAN